MRFALVENERVEAAPELQGVCPGCGASVIAHCGKQRIWHWKHRTAARCDRWWETETEWHRNWKDRFPWEWQEIRHSDAQTGEIHIADVLTVHGVVIEFQHSHLHPEERTAREGFYKNLIWIVDGTRLKRDFPRFRQGMKDYSRPTNKQGYFFVDFPDEVFPSNWITSPAPVIFDFRGLGVVNQQEPMRDALWCLHPDRVKHRAVVLGMSTNDLVNVLFTRAQL